MRGLVASSARRFLSTATAASSPAAAARGHPLPPALQLAAARGLLGSHLVVDVGVCSRLHNPCSLFQVSAKESGNAFDIGSVQLNQFIPYSARPLYDLGIQVTDHPCLSNMQCVFTPETEGSNQVSMEQQTFGSEKGGHLTEENWSGLTSDEMLHGLDNTIKSCINEVETKELNGDSGKGAEDSDQNSTDSGKAGEGTQGNGQDGGHEGSQGNGGRGKWDGYDNYLLYMLAENRKAESFENYKILESNDKLRTELEAFRRETTERVLKIQITVTRAAFQVILFILLTLLAAAQYSLAFTPAGKALTERIKKVLGADVDE